MGWFYQGNSLRRTITKQETKICPLCGGLNYCRNSECFICGWGGQFEANAAAIDFQWQCLIERFEEVRLEHVLRRTREIGDFGKSPRRSLGMSLRAVWLRAKHALHVRQKKQTHPVSPKTLMPPK